MRGSDSIASSSVSEASTVKPVTTTRSVSRLHGRASADTVPQRPDPSRMGHCWVTDEHGHLPGLLLEWR
jgi:hypothetical protein